MSSPEANGPQFVAPPPPPTLTRPSRRWGLWTIIAVGMAFSIAALAVSAAKWWSTPSAPPGAPPPAPAFSDEQVQAAKKAACDAGVRIDEPLTTVAVALAAFRDRSAPEAQDALARFQTVTLVEIEYLKTQTGPAAPEPVRAAVNGYVAALLAEVDGATRLLPDGEMNVRVRQTKAAGKAFGEACK